MNAAALDNLRPRRPGGMGRGAAMALVAHVGLVIAIAFGVSWRSSEPTGATAELWAAVPEVAAPAAVAPPIPTPPQARPEPKVEPPPPKPEVREAEIALEKAKAEKARREEQDKADALAKKRAQEQAAKLEREKAAQAAQAEKADAERLAKLREDQLKRIQGQAGATGGPQSTGTAQRDAGPSASYAGRIIARVKPNIVLTEAVPAAVRAVVEVRASPDGTIVGRRLVKPSGNKDWDDAVLRAIDRTEVLPRDVDGRVPSSIEIGFTP
jgi:colicin import membrane protein